MFFYAKIEGVVHMNQQVIEYYENLFKNEIMHKQFDGTRKTLKEFSEQLVRQDEAHKINIHTAYANVIKELVG